MNLKDAMKRGPECPALEELIDGSDKFQAHVDNCTGCQSELAMFRGFEAPPSPAEREMVDYIVTKLRPVPKPPLWAWLMSPVRLGGFALAAAAVILSVGLASQWRTRHLEPVGETGVTRSATIRVETPLDHLAAAPAEIRWQAVEGAGTYEILIAEVDRTVVFHKNFTTPVLPVPLELGSLLLPGKSLTLKITARDAAGKELATSGPLSLRVELDH